MSRKLKEPIVRRHIVFFEKDWERIVRYFNGNVGASGAVRHIVRAFLDNVEAKAEGKAQRSALNIDLEGLSLITDNIEDNQNNRSTGTQDNQQFQKDQSIKQG